MSDERGARSMKDAAQLPTTAFCHTPLATRHFRPRRADAFTLIELLVVIAVIAILAGLTLSALGYVNKRGAESRARAEVAALSTAIESYKMQFGAYPATNNLYNELTGQGLVNSNRVLFEPTPGMVDTNVSPRRFIDPWGSAYNYSTNQSTIFNVGFFDLWTTNNSTNSSLWIRN
jgi:prepilin-type N-terminal cleavage/methylation domain-containing protein